MSDYISREEAIEKLAQYIISVTKQFNMTALPYAVYESRARSVLKDIPGRQIEQVASKLKNHCDSLLKSDAAECKEHESKLDLISRADAIEAACNEMDWLDDGCVEERKTMIKDALSALPSAEAVQGWIPCSERLPEENEVVLTQAKFKDGVKMAVSSRIDVNYWTGWGTREINIIAWMPLPKPYDEREDE